MSRSKLFMEFSPRTLCGLCGNKGIIDTRQMAVSSAGVECGVRAYCICPNGRGLKKAKTGTRWGDSSVLDSEWNARRVVKTYDREL